MPQKGQIIRKQKSSGINSGDTLTFIGNSEHEPFTKGVVEYLEVIEGFYGILDIWVPEKINGIKLVGIYGHWFPRAFIETQNIK